MSKIDDLIKQYCPNGVEYKELGKIVNILDSQRRPVAKEKRKKGNIPYYGANGIQDWVDDYIFDGTFLLIGEDGSVINKDNTPVLNWATGKIWVNNHAHILSEKIEEANLRYVYFILSKTNVCSIVRGMPPKLNQLNLRGIKIPIPPLPVQEEIVKVLDAFTALEAELEAELEARKRQYEYYRNKLLTFDENTTGEGRIKFMQLGDVGTFIRGNGLQKKDFTDTGVGCIHYGQIYTYYGTFAERTKSYVSNELAEKLKKAQTGDLIIATTSENVEDVGKAVAWLGNEDICIGGHSYAFHHNQNPKYMAYLFQTEAFNQQKKKVVKGVKVIDINDSAMSKFKFGFPPLDEQERIVAILDKFDSLVNDISEGLPAELTARRQQYEYYRNKLLTFEEAA